MQTCARHRSICPFCLSCVRYAARRIRGYEGDHGAHKIESGKDELHEGNIETLGLLYSVLKLVGHNAEQRRLKLELVAHDQIPALYADERKLMQILINLLSNAIKFTDVGGEGDAQGLVPYGQRPRVPSYRYRCRRRT